MSWPSWMWPVRPAPKRAPAPPRSIGARDREDAGSGRRRSGGRQQRRRDRGQRRRRRRERLRAVHDDPHAAGVRAAAPQRPAARVLDVQAHDVAPGHQLQRPRQPQGHGAAGRQAAQRPPRHRAAARQPHDDEPRAHARHPALAHAQPQHRRGVAGRDLARRGGQARRDRARVGYGQRVAEGRSAAAPRTRRGAAGRGGRGGERQDREQCSGGEVDEPHEGQSRLARPRPQALQYDALVGRAGYSPRVSDSATS